MTSRDPRDSRLRFVPRRPLAAPRAAARGRGWRPAPRPPEGTPSTAELARLARADLAAAARVAHWAAGLRLHHDGVCPHGKGALLDAHVQQAALALDLTAAQFRIGWDTARLAGLVEVHGGSARPGRPLRTWDSDDSGVLRAWVALFDAWSLAYPEPAGHGPDAVADVVEAMHQVLSLLQLSAGAVPMEPLLDLLEQRVTELRAERCEAARSSRPEPTGPSSSVASSDVDPAEAAEETALAPLLDWALRALAAVGALTYDDGQATLTPLGSWAVWVKLEQICVAAQSPVSHIEQSAPVMLRGCARLSPGPARAEYRAWLAARPVGSAVTELLDAARGDDALLRGLAFEVLRVVGAPAEPAVHSVAEEPTLRPYALLWLAEHEGVDPEDALDVLTREEATWLWVDTAAAVADHGEAPLLVRHLESAPQPTIPALLDEVRAIDHPRTVQVLVALAAAHPDPALAKAVRRAAFQMHVGMPLAGPARPTGVSAEPPARTDTRGAEDTAHPALPAPPRCRAHLMLLDDDPRAGIPVRLTVQLVAESAHPWGRPGARPPLDVVAVPLSSADVVPATVLYGPGDAETAQFRVTAAEPGTHRIRFTFLHHGTGVVLQQVEADLDLAAADPTRVGKRQLRPHQGRA